MWNAAFSPEEKMMRCVLCKNGGTKIGGTTVALDRDGTTIIVREVPAEICDVCGEYYLSENVASDLPRRAEDATARGAEVEIQRWVAA